MPDNNDTEKPQLLIADDSKVIRKSISKLLGGDYQVIEAADGLEAWEILQENREIRLLFSDLGMPRMDGYELLEAIRKADDKELAEIPVIIVTGKEDTEAAKEKMLELGATDLIGKPFHSAELKSRTRSYIDLNRKVKQLEKASPVDKSTGLATADYFKQQADINFSLSQRHGHDITVARINIDNLAQLREDFSQGIVTKVIATVGKLLLNDIRKEDLAAHIGEEKFAVILPCADPDSANEAMARVRKRLEKLDLRIGEKVAHISFTVGIVSHSASETITDFSHLMALAEEALQQAEKQGGDRTVTLQPKEETVPELETESINVQLDELLSQLTQGEKPLTDEQLRLASKKFLPLLAKADQQLKLGLGKVILHLHRRLKQG